MKLVKAFITVDQYIDNTTDVISPVYELSDYAMTYSKVKKQYYYSKDPSYSLYLFNTKQTDSLTQTEVDNIITIVQYLNQFLNQNVTYDKQILVLQVISYLNNVLINDIIFNIDYMDVVGNNTIKAADYITFTTQNLQVSIWCGYQQFENFYPDYEVDNVLPFDNFAATVRNPVTAINILQNFDIAKFNLKIQTAIGKKPPTAIKIINLPYTVSSTGFSVNCYFGFIIYGSQGNYDYILKLQLFDYLQTLGLSQAEITNMFPDILKVNEFFIIPRWDMVAMPSQVGSYAINSQVTKTYDATFDTNNFITVYQDQTFIKDNTYNVPFDYNNILLQITNGYYTQEEYKDFLTYYHDIINVNSLDTDFARMSTKTQNFISMVYSVLDVVNCNNNVELMNKVVAQRQYILTVVIRGGITYLSLFFDKHQYYFLPKFEMIRIQSGG